MQGTPAPEDPRDKRRLGLFGLSAEVTDVADSKAGMGIPKQNAIRCLSRMNMLPVK